MSVATVASIVMMAAALPALAQGPGGCPPGLAKKGSCVPPGQARTMAIYAPPPIIYQPPVAYVQPYRDYYPPPQGGSLNIGVTVPLQ
jgi:hypothetical protein